MASSSTCLRNSEHIRSSIRLLVPSRTSTCELSIVDEGEKSTEDHSVYEVSNQTHQIKVWEWGSHRKSNHT